MTNQSVNILARVGEANAEAVKTRVFAVTGNKLEQALELQKMGLCLVPINLQTKRPYFELLPKDAEERRPDEPAPRYEEIKPRWWPLRVTPASPEAIKSWFEYDPECAIAVCTGNTGGTLHIAVIEVDPRDGGNESLDKLEEKLGELPRTVEVLSGGEDGGRHFYLLYPNIEIRCGHIADGVEVKGYHKYAVAPLSGHKSGGLYVCADGRSFDEIEIAEFPRKWLEYITAGNYEFLTEKKNNGKAVRTKKNAGKSGKGKANEYHTIHLLKSDTPCIEITDRGLDLTPLFKRKNVDIIRMCLPTLGIPAGKLNGSKFLCVLHEESCPSANLYWAKNGVITYCCWHLDRHFLLAEVYASLSRGEVVYFPHDRDAAATAAWSIRLLVDSGVLVPADIPTPQITVPCVGSVKTVWDGFWRLWCTVAPYSPGSGVPYTWRYASAWCGVSENTAGEAIRKLLKLGYIRYVDPVKARRRVTAMFLPGTAVSENEAAAAQRICSSNADDISIVYTTENSTTEDEYNPFSYWGVETVEGECRYDG